TIALLRRQIESLQANAADIEASTAWRILQVCNRLGFLALPRAILRFGRGLRGGNHRLAPPVAPPPPPPPAPLAAPAAKAAEFHVPVPITSDVFAELLKRRPASFQKVYEAPALMSPQERVFLYGLTFAMAPERYLEIGTCRGGSAVIVSAAMDDLNRGQAFGLDPEPAVAAETLAGIRHRFTLVPGHSPRDIPGLAQRAGGKFDLILVDGDHSYEATLADLRGVLPVASPEAVILIHDAYNAEVSRAVDDFVKSLDGQAMDAGMLATSCNEMSGAGGPLKWGGLRLLRLRTER
ncbi:MAG: class I SAM-dependent methyltransferase, partial [Tepidisphaeraceae bacterium]